MVNTKVLESGFVSEEVGEEMPDTLMFGLMAAGFSTHLLVWKMLMPVASTLLWVLCGVVWCCVALCGVVWCGAVRCGAVRCGAVRCGAVRCGAVRCGAVWCGVVRCGEVWCGEVR